MESKTKSKGAFQPDPPTFTWELSPTKNDEQKIDIIVIWMPKVDGVPGSHFFVKYRIKGRADWNTTHVIFYEDFKKISSLLKNNVYELSVVSVDGEYLAESEVQEISTITKNGVFNENPLLKIYSEINFVWFDL